MGKKLLQKVEKPLQKRKRPLNLRRSQSHNSSLLVKNIKCATRSLQKDIVSFSVAARKDYPADQLPKKLIDLYSEFDKEVDTIRAALVEAKKKE
ncbi:unnamed protein product [Nesidiocoris tenuis]|uniref:Uncharacterized protein n=1 Tax=Nesidiocoris tenuis TaxID=355587 RepID=A0A6H5GJ14_9HEMI|nr:unnamed protein product [Nesidiocoris tenuis]